MSVNAKTPFTHPFFLGVYFAFGIALMASAHANTLDFEVLEQYPHATRTFTQGLEVYNGDIIESSGLYRRSFVRMYTPQTQDIQKHIDLPKDIFAEGLTRVGNHLYLLTWRSHKALVYDLTNWQLMNTFEYQGDGWGLCYDGTQLYMSDGSHTLTVRDPKTFEVKNRLTVTDLNNKPVVKLNELECAEGYVWANKWMSPYIFQINPQTGKVHNTLDLTQLIPFHLRKNRESVLNGIAYDKEKKAYWVTGKYWNKLFLISIKNKK